MISISRYLKLRHSPLRQAAICLGLITIAVMPRAAPADAGVDPWVEQQFQRNDRVEFIVRLKARAELAYLRSERDVLSRRTAIVDRLRATAADTQAPLLARLEQLGVEFRPFWIANAIWIRGNRQLLDELRSRGDIAWIHANPQVRLDFPKTEPQASDSPDAIEWNILLIGAPDVWSQGFTGQGAVIGGQDTGYDWDHPALLGKYRGWDGGSADHNYNWHDSIHEDNVSCNGDSPFPCDDNGHGTHTMGTMVGDDGGNNQIGVAPGAKWIGCRNMNQGNGTPASYMECFEWFVAPTDLDGMNPDPSKAPNIISNSWSCPPSEGCTDVNILLDTVNNTVAAGILVVVSAGNNGSQCSTVSTPAAIYEASFSVGSTTSSDTISSFSSRGPVIVDSSNRLKPDISAPGSGVRSSLPGGGYGTLSGTSMAAPHVAGLAALMISRDPGLAGDPSTLKSRMRLNAVPLTGVQTCGGIPGSEIPNNTFGYGRIDAVASVFQLPEEFFDGGFETSLP